MEYVLIMKQCSLLLAPWKGGGRSRQLPGKNWKRMIISWFSDRVPRGIVSGRQVRGVASALHPSQVFLPAPCAFWPVTGAPYPALFAGGFFWYY